MYGYGKSLKENIELFKKYNITDVVAGVSKAEIETASLNDVSYYVCANAFESAHIDNSCICVSGEKVKYSKSICPNKREVMEEMLSKFSSLARIDGIKGIVVDRCRYPSTVNGTAYDFFSCFCSDCINKMNELGFDAERIKTAVYDFYMLIKSGGSFDADKNFPLIKEWFLVKKAIITRWFSMIYKTIKDSNKKTQVGAYLFTPSLSSLVGQNYSEIELYTDFLSPMVYRYYPCGYGPACFDQELLGIYSYFEGRTKKEIEIITECFKFGADFDISQYPDPDTLKSGGLESHFIELEVRKAKNQMKKARLRPIIMLDDVDLPLSVDAAVQGGADMVNFFIFNEKIADEKMRQLL